jgi:hypothetical protein
VLGSLWLLGYGVAATFRDASHDILEGPSHALELPWCWGLLAMLTGFALHAWARRRWAVLAIASVALLPLITVPLVGQGETGSALLSWLATLHLSGIGITLILLDFIGKHGASRLGALLLSVLIIARMADSHFSLLAKGLAFIAVGVAFLAFNFFMSRHQRQQNAAQA